MTPAGTRSIMIALARELALPANEYDALVRRGEAALRVRSASSTRWGVVHTPGDRWVAAELDNGYSWDHFGEEISPDDLTELLRERISAVREYCVAGAVRGPRAWLVSRAMVVSSGGREVVFAPSLAQVLRPRRRRRQAVVE